MTEKCELGTNFPRTFLLQSYCLTIFYSRAFHTRGSKGNLWYRFTWSQLCYTCNCLVLLSCAFKNWKNSGQFQRPSNFGGFGWITLLIPNQPKYVNKFHYRQLKWYFLVYSNLGVWTKFPRNHIIQSHLLSRTWGHNGDLWSYCARLRRYHSIKYGK